VFFSFAGIFLPILNDLFWSLIYPVFRVQFANLF